MPSHTAQTAIKISNEPSVNENQRRLIGLAVGKSDAMGNSPYQKKPQRASV
jgi:hypothetical protein